MTDILPWLAATALAIIILAVLSVARALANVWGAVALLEAITIRRNTKFPFGGDPNGRAARPEACVHPAVSIHMDTGQPLVRPLDVKASLKLGQGV